MARAGRGPGVRRIGPRPRAEAVRRPQRRAAAAAAAAGNEFQRYLDWRFAQDGYQSAAVRRDDPASHDRYYPREWFAQKENTNLSVHGDDVVGWLASLKRKRVGARLSADEKRNMFWSVERSTRETSRAKRYGERARAQEQTTLPAAGCGLFAVPYLDWSVERGCMPLLSPKAAHLLYAEHRRCVEELNVLVSGSPAEAMPLDELVITTARDSTMEKVHELATRHWNRLFFWRCIVPYGSVDVPIAFHRAVWRDFPPRGYVFPYEDELPVTQSEAMRELARVLLEEVLEDDLTSERYVWLVADRQLGKMRSFSTGPPRTTQCPLSVDLVPLLCIPLCADLLLDGASLADLFRRWWHTVDWEFVGQCHGTSLKDDYGFLSADLEGRQGPNDVHVFPSMPTLREQSFQQAQASGGKEDPLAHIKAQWEVTRALFGTEREDQVFMGPGMHQAEKGDQQTQLRWHLSQQYHILATHADMERPPPTQWLGWEQTERWFEQQKAKAQLHRTASHPPPSGIPWPEENNKPLLVEQTEDPEAAAPYQDGDPKPWEEVEEQWLHNQVHRPEHDFWRRRATTSTASNKNAVYYGMSVKSN
eukprot:TRINITY_DN70345_c0_g1_i1.p1 TRINITY_DN70345_c0_g1~~TRINITY_DN70345_c0_g1_i1.p1  ORF type:complete len:614 (+),score=177.58 TRINITY_DN70345_c0_g1_i1:73-1842(+)